MKTELRAKKELQETYGKDNIIKVTIGKTEAFLVVGCGELIKLIKVHSFYLYQKEKIKKITDKNIAEFSKSHYIPAEFWIYIISGKRRNKINKEVYNLYEVK